MPPKKKVVTAVKVSKKESLKETEQAPEITSSEPKKIPKRPFFRHVDCDSLKKAQHIRVKLWKIHSCSQTHLYSEPIEVDPILSFTELMERGQREARKRKEKLTNTFKSLTIKRSLKHVKKIKFDPSLFTKYQFIKQLWSTWRLDSLSVLVPQGFEDYDDVLQPFLNSNLKKCYLLEGSDNIIGFQSMATFRIMRKCKLVIGSSCSRSLKIWINTALLPSPRKLKSCEEYHETWADFMNSQIIKNAPECLEEMRLSNFSFSKKGEKINPGFPPLPNLRGLTFAQKKEGEKGSREEDFSFVRQYSKLQSLKMILTKHEVKTLDFLADLPDLKSFFYISHFPFGEQPSMKSLPNLTKLEKLKLHLETGGKSNVFTGDHVKDFIDKNRGLKDLDLGLNVQELGTIFEEDEDFVLPDIEKLRLNFLHLERPYAGAAKRIAEVLKTQDFIKELALEFCYSYADLNATLLKDGVAKMKSLEKLTLRWRSSGGLEENKYKNLKDVFTNQTRIVALDLDFGSEAIGSREFGMILDGLAKLPNLKRLKLKAMILKITPAVFNKLSSFIGSLRSSQELEFILAGFSKEEREELRQIRCPKFPLTKDWLSFPGSETREFDLKFETDQEYLRDFW